MTRAFAPTLARNGGSAIVYMLSSVVSGFVNPFNASDGVFKHAALAVTDAGAGAVRRARASK